MTAEPLPSPLRRAAILAEGGTDKQIRARRRTGLATVRPGSYLDGAEWSALKAEAQHRILVASTLPHLATGAVVSHASAALIHGMPILGVPPAQVHVTRDQPHGGNNRRHLHTHLRTTGATPFVFVGGVPVTTIAQTVVDCASSLDFESAVVIADAAIYRRLTTKPVLEATLASTGRRRGADQARKVLAFADGRSESPGESSTRVRLWRIGFPKPILQYAVRNGSRLIARCDFCWPEFRTIGEFDGAIKYDEIPKDDEDLKRVVRDQLKRQQDVQAQIWEVVRWGWTDLADPQKLAILIRGGFERAKRFNLH